MPEEKPKEEPKEEPKKEEEPISEYDKALALVKRREEASKVELEILAKKEKLAANAMLGGETGGHIEPKTTEETPEDYAKKISAGTPNE